MNAFTTAFAIPFACIVVCIADTTAAIATHEAGVSPDSVRKRDAWSLSLEVGHHDGYLRREWYRSAGVNCTFDAFRLDVSGTALSFALEFGLGAGVHSTYHMDAFGLSGLVPYLKPSLALAGIIGPFELAVGGSLWFLRFPDSRKWDDPTNPLVVHHTFQSDALYGAVRIGFIVKNHVLRIAVERAARTRTYETRGADLQPKMDERIPWGIMVSLGSTF